MKCVMCAFAFSVAATVNACGHIHRYPERFTGLQQRLSKRQAEPVASLLDSNEAILRNSFDNTTIESWSYYYTHGLHVAGTNQSMAHWTADRWAENGFESSLVQYCTPRPQLTQNQHFRANGFRYVSQLPGLQVDDLEIPRRIHL
jgi:N-acetylated-alpha-linked acidic dipeptidase